MKLLYITNGINGAGGLERVLSIKASLLADNFGYEVYILVLNDANTNCFYNFSDKINMLSIEVFGNPFSYWQNYKNGIKKVVNEIQPDVISVCDDGLKAFFIPQILAKRKAVIYERHVSKLIEANDRDNLIKRSTIRFKWWLMEKKAKNFARFILLTEGNKKEWPSLNNKVVIENPVSFYPKTSSSLDQKIVISVGKISYQKGQDLLIKAWNIVHDKFPDWELHLYGKENLQMLDTSNLQNNVRFFTPEKKIEEKYLNSSLYVMSSRYEGFGMVLIEAMACGVPCVSFDCDYGPSDIIRDGIDGLLARKENVENLADKILQLIENSENRKNMGHQAKWAVTRYLPESIVQKWDNLFKQLVTEI